MLIINSGTNIHTKNKLKYNAAKLNAAIVRRKKIDFKRESNFGF
jgi:hypothetical protein